MDATGTTPTSGSNDGQASPFRHEAFFYAGEDEFLTRASSFVREGVEAGEPVLVMIAAQRGERLREVLGPWAEGVSFRDMGLVGRNPARIIPAWHEFFSAVTGPVRGIGEPIWPGRSEEELVEARRHEELLNLAFTTTTGYLLCPYDVSVLHPQVVEGARRSHPVLSSNGDLLHSEEYLGPTAIAAPFGDPLPDPPDGTAAMTFGAEGLEGVRAFVQDRARAAGLPEEAQNDLILAVSEVAANSVRHAGGGGEVRVWEQGRSVVVEIRDAGLIRDPMAGRVRPAGLAQGGFGLWLANQLCDLVQIRSASSGSAVRLWLAAS